MTGIKGIRKYATYTSCSLNNKRRHSTDRKWRTTFGQWNVFFFILVSIFYLLVISKRILILYSFWPHQFFLFFLIYQSSKTCLNGYRRSTSFSTNEMSSFLFLSPFFINWWSENAHLFFILLKNSRWPHQFFLFFLIYQSSKTCLNGYRRSTSFSTNEMSSFLFLSPFLIYWWSVNAHLFFILLKNSRWPHQFFLFFLIYQSSKTCLNGYRRSTSFSTNEMSSFLFLSPFFINWWSVNAHLFFILLKNSRWPHQFFLFFLIYQSSKICLNGYRRSTSFSTNEMSSFLFLSPFFIYWWSVNAHIYHSLFF